MSFGGRPYHGGAFASGQRSVRRSGGGFVIPDGLGGKRTNFVVSNALRYPYRSGVFGGLGAAVPLVAGAVTFPNPERATVELAAWWAYSEAIRLTRVHPGGERVPVRGSSPRATGGATRRNGSLNPRCGGSASDTAATRLAGWNPGAGTSAPELLTMPVFAPDDPSPRPSFPRGTDAAARFTVAAGGRASTTLPVIAGAATTTESVAIRLPDGLAPSLKPSNRLYPSQRLRPSRPRRARLDIAWFDVGGVALESRTVPLDPVRLTRAARSRDWERLDGVVRPPSDTAVKGIVTLVVDGLPVGGRLDVTAHLSEVGETLGGFFDGTGLGHSWLGAPHRSPSTASTVVSLTDGECPFDVPVRYEVTNARVPGVRVLTEPVVLASGNRTWMTDPLDPEHPFPVEVATDPELTRDLALAVFQPPGRDRPVVRSEAKRHGPTGDAIVFNTASPEQHAKLLQVLRSPLPKLLRAPADHRWEPNRWVRLGPLKETNPAGWAAVRQRTLTMPFWVVDRPVLATAQVNAARTSSAA